MSNRVNSGPANPGDGRAGGRRAIAAANARLAAVQATYLLETKDAAHVAAEIPVIVDAFIAGNLGGLALLDDEMTEAELTTALEPLDPDLFRHLTEGAWQHRDRMAAAIQDHLPNWELARLEAVLRAILLIAAFEIYARPQTPARVAINEYVDIAKSFFAESQPAMVNGVLDKLARAMRPDEFDGPV